MPFLLALAVPVLFQAEPPPPPTSESAPILIQGARDRDHAIHDFVTAMTPARIGGQLSRFTDEVCPAAVGLPDAQNRLVAQRLRDIAAAADVPLQRPGCAPNTLVIVVQDKDRFVSELWKRFPVYFAGVATGPKDLPRDIGPAVAWHIDGLLDADGMPAGHNSMSRSGVGVSGDARGVGGMQSGDRAGGNYIFTRSVDSTRIRPATIHRFMGAILVVEARSLVGLTTTQLADYAALRLYAKTDPHKLKPGAYTIMAVLDAPMGTPVPVTMTSWDLAFLKGLYHSDDRQYANRQRNEIEHAVRKGATATDD